MSIDKKVVVNVPIDTAACR